MNNITDLAIAAAWLIVLGLVVIVTMNLWAGVSARAMRNL